METSGVNERRRQPAEDGANETGAGWWQRDRAQRWRYGLGAVFLGVLLPVAAGIPDPGSPVRRFGSSLAIVASATWVFAAVLLFLAATIGRRQRELVLAGVLTGLLVAHPTIDQVAVLGSDAVLATRHGLGAIALCTLANRLDRTIRPVRAVSWIVLGGALVAIWLWTIRVLSYQQWLQYSATICLSITAVLCGSAALVLGQRHGDGAIIAGGFGALSLGFGQTLGLLGGHPGTLSVVLLAIVASILALTASTMAVMESLDRRERATAALGRARARELARLSARSERFAELAHDQTSGLLAIEAAATRLTERRSDTLAAAVAAESKRLRNLLEDTLQDRADSFDVESVVRSVVQCLEPLHGPIDLRVEAEHDVVGDPDRLALVLRTLIDNAYDHGAAPVTIRTAIADDGLVISISDSGQGVPEAFHEAIFDRGVTTAPRDHSGLGLYSARRMARDAGGDVRVSALDAATFELVLPLDADTGSTTASPVEAAPSGETPTAPGGIAARAVGS